MRRTVLSALALAGTAVLAGALPAHADGGSPSAVPTTRPSATAKPAPSAATPAPSSATPVPSAEPTRAPESATPSPSAEPTRAPSPGQVPVVPSGAPDTGVTADSDSSRSGAEGGLVGGTAAAVLVAGGVTFFVVRRRRANGA